MSNHGQLPFPLRNLTETVAEQMRRWILSGDLKQGERVSDAEIAHRLGTSRSPVREALRQLERDGLLQSVPNRGAVVRSLTPEDLVQLYGIRMSLEGLALRWAMDKITNYEVARLRGLCEEIEAMLPLETEDDRERFRGKTSEFHQRLVAMAGSPLLDETLQGIWAKIELAMATVNRHSRVSDVVPEHLALVEALERRDLEASLEALEKVMEGAKSRGLALLAEEAASALATDPSDR